MTNLAEAIQNACEIARQDERRKFKEYLEKKMLYASFVMPSDKKKDIRKKEIETGVYYRIINELFGGE